MYVEKIHFTVLVFDITMPTVLLVDCSLGMAERFSFVIKQADNMETTMSIEKRSIIAKLIEALMAHSTSPTKLETIALVRCFVCIDVHNDLFRFFLRAKIRLKLFNILREIQKILLNQFKKYRYSVIIH